MAGSDGYKSLCVTNRQTCTPLQSINIYIFMGCRFTFRFPLLNLGDSCWLISTQLLKHFRRATQAGDSETAEISALSSRSGGQWSARKVCRPKNTLSFMGESTLTFKLLNSLSGLGRATLKEVFW